VHFQVAYAVQRMRQAINPDAVGLSDYIPPLHPGCTCFLVPHIDEMPAEILPAAAPAVLPAFGDVGLQASSTSGRSAKRATY
jgi:hypothetical protein